MKCTFIEEFGIIEVDLEAEDVDCACDQIFAELDMGWSDFNKFN